MQVSVPFLNDTQFLENYPMISPKIHVCAGELNKTTCNVIIKFLIFNYHFT